MPSLNWGQHYAPELWSFLFLLPLIQNLSDLTYTSPYWFQRLISLWNWLSNQYQWQDKITLLLSDLHNGNQILSFIWKMEVPIPRKWDEIFLLNLSGGHLNIKMSSYQYKDAHVEDKMVSRLSYLWHGSLIPEKDSLHIEMRPYRSLVTT